jgi:arginase family enzyme
MDYQPLRVAINHANKATILAKLQTRIALLNALNVPDNEAEQVAINNLDDQLTEVSNKLDELLQSVEALDTKQIVDHLERCLMLGGHHAS